MTTQRSGLVVWQFEQIEAECALLQGHATDPSCPCESETEHCIRKHLLTIEALAKETYPMVNNDQEKQQMDDLANQARTWRKQVEQLTLNNNPEPAAPAAQPFRIERTETDEIRIYKELEEFHQGSLRTIKHDDTLVLVGCPADRATWQNQECVCRDTGERGCMELHSITRPIS